MGAKKAIKESISHSVTIQLKDRMITGTQFTIPDERWYNIEEIWYPSVTYIQSVGLPTAEHLLKWYGAHSYEEAKRLMREAGDRGVAVHDAIDAAINGKTLKEKDYTIEQWGMIDSAKKWMEEYKPIILRNEYVVYSKKHWFAGTVDLKCIIAGKVYIIDFKTSKGVYLSHETQCCAYEIADFEMGGIKIDEVAVLKLSTTGYEFKVIKNRAKMFKTFKAAHFIFRVIVNKTKPFIKIYPTEIKFNLERRDEYAKRTRVRKKPASRRATKK